MAILNDLQALFAQCPVLQELAPRTDQIETVPRAMRYCPRAVRSWRRT